jgi:hypothetical protein
MDLLMLVGQVLVQGGMGGLPGKNGFGGFGGPGGKGGPGLKWQTKKEETKVDNKGQKKVEVVT